MLSGLTNTGLRVWALHIAADLPPLYDTCSPMPGKMHQQTNDKRLPSSPNITKMWGAFEKCAAGASLAGFLLSGASLAERHPSFLAWRLASSLRDSPFCSTPDAAFSDLTSLVASGERVFSREPLEEHVVARLRSAFLGRNVCLIVGGAGGIGKSVFFESLLLKRALSNSSGVWKGFAGPTRVVNLLECSSLDDFHRKVVQSFHPLPFLPSFGLSPPPSYDSTLAIMKEALARLPAETPLVVFVEDINSLVTWSGWQADFVKFTTIIGSSHNGLVVGNSSALLAYTQFESLSHVGLRTKCFFLPSLPQESEDLAKYALDGGHLYQAGFAPPQDLKATDLSHLIAVWDGNVQMIKDGSDADVNNVFLQIQRCLEGISLDDKPQWAHLVTPACVNAPAAALGLRTELLQILCDAPGNEVRLSALPPRMRALRIVEQLASVDLVTFRTVKDRGGVEFVAVAPYYPAVLQQFKLYKAAQ